MDKHHRTAERVRRLLKNRRALDSEIRSGMRQLSTAPDLITFKEWISNEMDATGLTYLGVFYRWKRGKYPDLKRVSVNERIVFVVKPPPNSIDQTQLSSEAQVE